MLTYDPDKNTKNFTKHGLWLADAHLFDFDGAIEDYQNVDGEERVRALGVWDDEFIAVVVYVEFEDEGKHVISARRADGREVLFYAEQKSNS